MSETTKHTPGPWSAGVYNDAANNSGWLYRINLGQPETDVEAHANARLIAAAPDLLAALEACVLPGATRFDIERARAAIAKAKGE